MIIANNISANNAQRQFNINNKNKSKSAEKLFSGVKINSSADDTNTEADREVIDREIQEIKREIDRIGNDTTFNEMKVLQGSERLDKYETIQQEVEKEKIVYLHVKGYGNVKNPYISTYFPEIESNQYYDLENIADTPLAGVSFGQYDYNKSSTKCFIVDFSNVNSQSDWEKLDGVSFTFVCAQGCGQMSPVYENSDIHIQYGAKSQQALKIKLPHIDCEVLNMVDVAGNPREKVLDSIEILSRVVENVSSAESRIRDTNMAEEMIKYCRHNILEEVGNAMIVQANQTKQGVLKLLE